MTSLKWHCLRLLAKILREKKSPEFVARGWAIGMFYGCLIPFGLQLVLSIPTAFALKGSKVGATVGTLVTNHFSIFVIYPAQCWVGSRLLGGNLSYAEIERALGNVIKAGSWDSLLALGHDLIAAFFLGGALLTAVMTPLTYFLVLGFIRRRRARAAAKK